MANRRTTLMGVGALVGLVVVAGVAVVVVKQHHPLAVTAKVTQTSKPITPQTRTSSPLAGGPTSAPLMMPVTGKIANEFGWQYSGTLNEWYYNPGLSISATKGRPVDAAWAGAVTRVTRDPHTGLSVTINDGAGFETVYGHLGQTDVRVGDSVHQGQPIGTVGGASLYSREAGSHLDFQVYHGDTATNPMSYLHPSS